MSEEVRITGLDPATTLAEGDLFVGVDVSDNTSADDGTEKKYTAKQILESTKDSTVTLTNKTISVDSNTISGIPASSFVVSNASGNIDGTASQKAIPSGVVVGTTDTQTLTNKTITTPTITGWDGWQDANETWTYASADDPTYTFTSPGDLTGKYSVGMKIMCTNNSTTFHGILTKIAYSSPNTTFTVYGGTDYDLANSAITNPRYSTQKAPYGFPLDPDKWSVTKLNTTQYSNATAASGTWYNDTNFTTAIPIGVWNVEYYTTIQVLNFTSASAFCYIRATLSTTNNSETNTAMTVRVNLDNPSSASYGICDTISRKTTLNLSSKTNYYINYQQGNGAGASAVINAYNNSETGILKAVCAYL